MISAATKLAEADSEFKSKLNRAIFENIVSLIPDQWLNADKAFASADENRAAYIDFLASRLGYSSEFIKEAAL